LFLGKPGDFEKNKPARSPGKLPWRGASLFWESLETLKKQAGPVAGQAPVARSKLIFGKVWRLWEK
jgi:hypothetical protein